MSKKPSFRDLTQLSAYLDGELNTSALKKMEDRLARDPELVAALDDLRLSRTVIRRTPKRRAPRNFTLTREMAGVRPPMPRLVPVLNYASVFAMLLLAFTFLNPFSLSGGMANDAMAPMAMEMETVMEESAAEEPMLEMAPEPPAADFAAEEEAGESEEIMEEAVAGEAGSDDASEGEDDVSRVGVEPTQVAESSAADSEIGNEAGVDETQKLAPTMVSPDVLIETTPDMTISLSSLQQILLIIALLSLLIAWGIRRATLSKWQKATK